jgi:hypothetical protein
MLRSPGGDRACEERQDDQNRHPGPRMAGEDERDVRRNGWEREPQDGCAGPEAIDEPATNGCEQQAARSRSRQDEACAGERVRG